MVCEECLGGGEEGGRGGREEVRRKGFRCERAQSREARGGVQGNSDSLYCSLVRRIMTRQGIICIFKKLVTCDNESLIGKYTYRLASFDG